MNSFEESRPGALCRLGVVLIAACLISGRTSNGGGTTVQKTAYKGWKNNLRITNGEVELIATLDVGPRIIRFGFVDGENAFKEYPDQLGKAGEDEWQIRGGHRLWHAPEAVPRTYFPDNAAVAWKELHDGGVRLTPPAETPLGIQKEIDVRLDPTSNHVTLVHRIKNVGAWPVELAPWSLTVVAPGGMEIIPLPEKVPHGESLLPNQLLVLWSYTDLADPRYHFGSKYITLKQDPVRDSTKIGLRNSAGWVAYLRDGLLFAKRFAYQEGKSYPDYGCNFETYTDKDMLEIESLGPLSTLQPGASVEHRETWELHKNVPAVRDARTIDQLILPLLNAKN